MTQVTTDTSALLTAAEKLMESLTERELRATWERGEYQGSVKRLISFGMIQSQEDFEPIDERFVAYYEVAVRDKPEGVDTATTFADKLRFDVPYTDQIWVVSLSRLGDSGAMRHYGALEQLRNTPTA